MSAAQRWKKQFLLVCSITLSLAAVSADNCFFSIVWSKIRRWWRTRPRFREKSRFVISVNLLVSSQGGTAAPPLQLSLSFLFLTAAVSKWTRQVQRWRPQLHNKVLRLNVHVYILHMSWQTTFSLCFGNRIIMKQRFNVPSVRFCGRAIHGAEDLKLYPRKYSLCSHSVVSSSKLGDLIFFLSLTKRPKYLIFWKQREAVGKDT